MRAALAAIALLALAGCTGSGSYEKGSAFEAHRFTRELAEAWQDDAVLLGLVGFEFAANQSIENRIDGERVEAFDERLGDGLARIWGAGYYSEDAGKVKAYLVIDGEVRREEVFEVGLGELGSELGALRSAARDWSIDSTDVADALGKDARYAPLAANLTRVIYGLDLEDAEWDVFGGTRTQSFEAELSAQSGDLKALDVREDVDVPIEDIPRVPPPPIHDEQAVQASVDILAPLGFTPCQAPTSSCFEYAFEAATPFDIEATLSWTNPANDFDLYLYQGEDLVGQSGQASPSSEEAIEETYSAGSYRLVVAAYAVAEDTFTLDAQFT